MFIILNVSFDYIYTHYSNLIYKEMEKKFYVFLKKTIIPLGNR